MCSQKTDPEDLLFDGPRALFDPPNALPLPSRLLRALRRPPCSSREGAPRAVVAPVEAAAAPKADVPRAVLLGDPRAVAPGDPRANFASTGRMRKTEASTGRSGRMVMEQVNPWNGALTYAMRKGTAEATARSWASAAPC